MERSRESSRGNQDSNSEYEFINYENITPEPTFLSLKCNNEEREIIDDDHFSSPGKIHIVKGNEEEEIEKEEERESSEYTVEENEISEENITIPEKINNISRHNTYKRPTFGSFVAGILAIKACNLFIQYQKKA